MVRFTLPMALWGSRQSGHGRPSGLALPPCQVSSWPWGVCTSESCFTRPPCLGSSRLALNCGCHMDGGWDVCPNSASRTQRPGQPGSGAGRGWALAEDSKAPPQQLTPGFCLGEGKGSLGVSSVILPFSLEFWGTQRRCVSKMPGTRVFQIQGFFRGSSDLGIFAWTLLVESPQPKMAHTSKLPGHSGFWVFRVGMLVCSLL